MTVKAKNDIYIEEFVNNPLYKISSNGEIMTRVAPTGKVYVDENMWRPLSLHIDKGGYRRIKYNYKKLQLHRIVYRKFVGFLDPTLEVNHKDGDTANNFFENLELITPGKNQEHSYRVLGRKPSMSNAKINMEIANEIRTLKISGWTNKMLREKFGLSKSNVSEIVNNKIWIQDKKSN